MCCVKVVDAVNDLVGPRVAALFEKDDTKKSELTRKLLEEIIPEKMVETLV